MRDFRRKSENRVLRMSYNCDTVEKVKIQIDAH